MRLNLDRQQIAVFAEDFRATAEVHTKAGHHRMARFYRALANYLAEELKQRAGHPVREDSDRWESLTVVASALGDEELIDVVVANAAAIVTLPAALQVGVAEIDRLFQPARDEANRRGLEDEIVEILVQASV